MQRYLDINQPGYSIKGKIYCDQIRDLDHVIVFLHGFGGHKDNKAAERFAEAVMSKMKKTAVFCFDWPCHGSDVRKKLTLADCSVYMDLVLDYIKKELKVQDICAYATSFGGYMTLKYIAEKGNPFRKIVLRGPAICMYESMQQRIMTEENQKLLEKGKEALVGFDRKVRIDRAFLEELEKEDITQKDFLDFADDILILHGTKDEIIPFEVSETFAENNVIELIPVEGADHRFQDLDKLKLAHSHMIEFLMQ